MAKAPEAGLVKTRLARTIGDARALRLAEAFLADTWQAVQRVPRAAPRLVLSRAEPPAPPPHPAPEAALPAAERVWDQGEGDLGQRLERALARALKTHDWAMAVGTDSPDLPRARLVEAGAILEAAAGRQRRHAVLGPTADGGYYLIGVTACPRGLLEGLPWSQEITFEATQSRLTSLGFSTSALPEWYDVDDAGDLERLRESLQSHPERAPRTHAVLATQVPAAS